MTVRRRICAAAVLTGMLLGGCTPTALSPAQRIAAHELQRLAPLQTQYKDVVTGLDVQGQTLSVFVDVDNLYSIDEQREDALKAQALARWRRVWSSAHPHAHATLTVLLRDYYGKTVFTERGRV